MARSDRAGDFLVMRYAVAQGCGNRRRIVTLAARTTWRNHALNLARFYSEIGEARGLEGRFWIAAVGAPAHRVKPRRA